IAAASSSRPLFCSRTARLKSSSRAAGPVTSAAAAVRSRRAAGNRPSSCWTAARLISRSASVARRWWRRAIRQASSSSTIAVASLSLDCSASASDRNARASAFGWRACLASATNASATGRNTSGSAATSWCARIARITSPSGGSVLEGDGSGRPAASPEPTLPAMHKGSVKQMESDQRNRGVPFPDDFSDWRSDTPGGTPEDVQWAVQQLAQLRYEPSVRHELLRLLKERREGADDAVQFDYLPAEVGFDTLLVKGELLITTESYFGYPGGLKWN